MKNTIFTICLMLAISFSASAQRVVVNYDMVGDSIISVYKVKKSGKHKVLNGEYIPRDAEISFRIKNINDAAWTINHTVTEETEPSSTNMNFLSAIIPTGFSGDAASGMLPFNSESQIENSSRGEEDEVWLDELETKQADTEFFLNNLAAIKAKLIQYFYDTNTSANDTRDQANALLNIYLGEEATNRGSEDYTQEVQHAIADARNAAQTNYSAARGAAAMQRSDKQISEIEFLYEKIIHSDYEISTRLDSDADVTRVNVNFYPILLDSMLQSSPAARYSKKEGDEGAAITRSFRFKSRGGLKITNSIGVSFTSLFGQGREYTVDHRFHDVKVSEEDNFIPNLMIGLNFFPVLKDNFSLGGTFGIGIPTTIFSGSFDVNFQLGAAMILGKKDVVTLSSGLLLGATEKLAFDYKVGDILPTSVKEDIVKTTYKPGLFIGISFKLASVYGGGNKE